MSNPKRKTVHRIFLAYQDKELEAWLEAEAAKGWHLVKPGFLGHAFIQGEPRKSTYRMDYMAMRGAKREEYLALFDDAGWDFLGETANHYYFRARPDAFSPEIHSDPESARGRIIRELRLIGGIFAVALWNTVIGGFMVHRDCFGQGLFREYAFPAVTVMALLTAVTLTLGWSVWKLIAALGAAKTYVE